MNDGLVAMVDSDASGVLSDNSVEETVSKVFKIGDSELKPQNTALLGKKIHFFFLIIIILVMLEKLLQL